LGIGLALVRGLTELHHGTIEAHSSGPGMGTEFIVRLPVLDVRPAVSPTDVPPAEKPVAGSKHRILVVDDNVDSAQSLGLLLTRLGHEIQIAHDGLEAVQAAGVFHPQVVLLDIGLPKMNGYEAAREIRRQPGGNNVILIALTGWGHEEDKRRAVEAGFDHHITKPVDVRALGRFLATVGSAR
jgi:CheY-like chemotaxis protein